MDPGHDAMAMATVRSHVPCSRPRLAPYAVAVSGSPTVLSGSCSEVQGARATSSGAGGSEGLGIHRTYPYPAYGGLTPVPGGQGEQQDDIANPTVV